MMTTEGGTVMTETPMMTGRGTEITERGGDGMIGTGGEQMTIIGGGFKNILYVYYACTV